MYNVLGKLNMQGVLSLLVFLGIVYTIQASCYTSELVRKRTLLGYKYMCRFNRRIMVDIGSDFTSDCHHCTCSEEGLRCCGIGFKAGVMAVEEGCEVVKNGKFGCEPVIVKAGEKNPFKYRYCDTGELVRKVRRQNLNEGPVQ